MDRRFLLAVLLLAVALAQSACGQDPAASLHAANVPVHPLVHALDDPTVEFPESFPMQVAVYRTDPTASMLPITHALGAMGVPFFVAQNLDQALHHHLVILYPETDGRTFSDTQIAQLLQHVENGGSLFAVNVFAGAARPLFGFSAVAPSQRRYSVKFNAGADTIIGYLNRPEELEVPLANPKAGDIFWSNGYTPDAHASVLARFEDGSAALLLNRIGKGRTYLVGVSYFDVVLRNQVNRDYEAERHYVNRFEPGADVWMLLLRAWYESNQPDAVRLDTMPSGHDSVLLLSHDIDWENSFAPALDFARMEKSHGTHSTFFIQTKYVSDANSKAFFFGKDLDDLKQLAAGGSSIGSHSIIHSREFNKFQLGSGEETFPAYQPRGTGFESATGATVFGEVRVSKELLDGQLPAQHTIFFRAGHLRVPPSLPEALQRSGYEFDSSFTAGDVLTNFPYRLPLDLGFAEDSGLYEFPVTFEDEESPLLQRIDQMLDIIRANAENGAANVLLIHPNQAGDKLAAEKELLRRLSQPALSKNVKEKANPQPDVQVEDMQAFAQFWRSRDRLQWTIDSISSAEVLLKVSSSEAVYGLTFDFNREIDRVDDAAATLLPDHHRLILPDVSPNEKLQMRIHYAR
jgi:hypothetical protein